MWHFLNPYSKGLNEDHGEIKPVESGRQQQSAGKPVSRASAFCGALGMGPFQELHFLTRLSSSVDRGCYSFKVLMCALSVTLAE